MQVGRIWILILPWLSLVIDCQGRKVLLTIIGDNCVTNSSSAMAPIYDLNSAKLDYKAISNEWRRHSKNGKKHCHFSTSTMTLYNCNGIASDWEVKSSLESGPIDNLIIDRRWEDSPMEITEQDGGKVTAAEIKNNGDFVVPFSVQIEMEAHVFLCEGEIPWYPCYWFLLQGWDGDNSGFRTCSYNEIPMKFSEDFKKTFCYTNNKYFKDDTKFLSGDQWTHLKIAKTGPNLKLTNAQGQVLFEVDVTSFNLNPRYVFFHSKKVNGLWKVHNFYYLFTKQFGSTSFNLQTGAGRHCLSMFVAMCPYCSMNIYQYTSQYNWKIVVNLKSNNEKWQYTRFFLEVTEGYLYLKIERIINYNLRRNNRNQPFWAISDVRTDPEDDFRILKPKVGTWTGKCQFLETGMVLDTKFEHIDSFEEECRETEFGESCIPCNVIFDGERCPKAADYCQLVEKAPGNVGKKCFCSIGYQATECQTVCEFGRYGHGCRNSCGNCQRGCREDTISGICNGARNGQAQCSNNYQGEKCNQPFGIFLFEDSPEISVEPTECSIRVKSFRGIGSQSSKRFYKVQYKMAHLLYWVDAVDPPIEFGVTKQITIKDLTPESNYEVRVFGFDDQEGLEQLTHVSPKITTFSTNCNPLSASQVNITKGSLWVNVSIAMTRNTCSLSSYLFTVDDHPLEQAKGATNSYKKENLEPYTRYVLKIKAKQDNTEIISEEFRTDESPPGKIENFRFRKDGSQINLLWAEPKKPNGELLLFSITAHLKELKACKRSINKTDVEEYIPVDKRSLLLKTKPYALYQMEIKAKNSAGFGESSWLDISTDMVEKIGEDEIPILTSIRPKTTAVTFLFDHTNCELLRGSLRIEVEVRGTDTWCDHTQTRHENGPLSEIKVSQLKPFCHYNATFQYFRNGPMQMETFASFITKDAVPNEIRELLVTSKGSDHIELRWLPPSSDPPTGVLEGYLIEISYFENGFWNTAKRELRNDSVSPTQCEIWPKYHCATVKNLLEKYVYTLNIRSKNKGNDAYSTPTMLNKKVQAWEKEPEKPYGLKATWTISNHLDLEWFHPNESNGRLINFQVDVKYGGRIQTVNIPILTYYPVYNITIRENLTFPETYSVSVKVNNSRGYSPKDSVVNIQSPPPIPEDYVSEIYRADNSIKVRFFRPDFVKNFTKFLYVLISECETCEDDLYQFRDGVVKHHSSSNKLEEAISVKHWMRLKASRWDPVYELIISNTTREIKYNVQKKTTYVLGFVWIHKYAGYVRSNAKVRITPGETSHATPRGHSYNTEKIIVISVSILVAILALLLIVGFKARLLDGLRNMFITGNSYFSRYQLAINPPSEPTYVNQETLNEMKTRRVRVIRPLSVLSCEEICPGVPSFKTEHSMAIKLERFENYVKNAIESGELARQHEMFPRGATKEWSIGVRPENKTKNRYQNLIAYDHSRVVLNKINNDEHSDYINANFIDGYRRPRSYIATQGPKSNTVGDFWRMIWQEKVSFIVMVANVIEGNKKKTEKYWPDINEENTFGDYKVSFIISEIHASYEYRKFELRYKYANPRQVAQLHFKVWPDHGVPLYPQNLVPFLKRMLRTKAFPFVVHCSAGVGRTGTIILCDLCLRMAAYEGFIDSLAMLEHLRNQRPNMVDNLEQYKLAHLVMINCMMGLDTSIPISQDFDAAVKVVDLDRQLDYIKSCEWQDDAMKSVAFTPDEELAIVPGKNRDPNIVPDNVSRMFLRPYDLQRPDVASTYINAVRVDGFCEPGRYIVTQFPLPNTIGDFWRLVAEKEISTIACLNDIPIADPTCKQFWPKTHGQFKPVGMVSVKHVRNKDMDTFDVITLELSTFYEYQENETRTIELMKFRGWNHRDPVPDHTRFTTFVEAASASSRSSKQVLVTCYDGATASGLFIATCFLMEKIKLEHECDVCQAVRSIRTSRKQFVNTKAQLEFLYKASVLYVEDTFFQYSNI